jgi:PAS domain S-box-containing protein
MSVNIPAESLWQAVCTVASSYIIVVDRDGTLLFANRPEQGRTIEEILGRNIIDFVPPESEQHARESLRAIFAEGGVHTLETVARQLSGALACYVVRACPIEVDGERVAALLCVDDVLPLKTSEETLRHERHVLGQLLEIQERERQLVSYEIHDGLSQYLAGAMMHLQALEHASATGTFEEVRHKHDLDESLRLLRAAVDESRRLIGGLRPPALDELGIVEVIESLAAEARAFIQQVDFHHQLRHGRLPPAIETTIFRIVQESLSNARKHANAKAVTIALDQPDAGHVSIVVRDDGVGFEPRLVPQDRFGLEGIRQRARLFGSEAEISSAPEKGTTIRVILPLAATADR